MPRQRKRWRKRFVSCRRRSSAWARTGKGGKSVGALEARLRSLRVFIIAAMIADDYVFPSLGDELEKQLRGPMGMGTDQHHKIRDYLRDFGPDQFKQAMCKLRAEKF